MVYSYSSYSHCIPLILEEDLFWFFIDVNLSIAQAIQTYGSLKLKLKEDDRRKEGRGGGVEGEEDLK